MRVTPLKRTTMTWWMGRPVRSRTALMVPFCPANQCAELIFSVPTPGSSTRKSRGIDSHFTLPAPGSVRITMMESARERVAPGRASMPITRVFWGADRRGPAGDSAALAAGVTRALASDTAPRTLRNPNTPQATRPSTSTDAARHVHPQAPMPRSDHHRRSGGGAHGSGSGAGDGRSARPTPSVSWRRPSIPSADFPDPRALKRRYGLAEGGIGGRWYRRQRVFRSAGGT